MGLAGTGHTRASSLVRVILVAVWLYNVLACGLRVRVVLVAARYSGAIAFCSLVQVILVAARSCGFTGRRLWAEQYWFSLALALSLALRPSITPERLALSCRQVEYL